MARPWHHAYLNSPSMIRLIKLANERTHTENTGRGAGIGAVSQFLITEHTILICLTCRDAMIVLKRATYEQ